MCDPRRSPRRPVATSPTPDVVIFILHESVHIILHHRDNFVRFMSMRSYIYKARGQNKTTSQIRNGRSTKIAIQDDTDYYARKDRPVRIGIWAHQTIMGNTCQIEGECQLGETSASANATTLLFSRGFSSGRRLFPAKWTADRA